LFEPGTLALVVSWFTHDTVKALIVAACVCTVLWKLLSDDDWHFHAESGD
jgi:hypothetical protein